MSVGDKLRFRMGCGEPLQSRSWVVCSARVGSCAPQQGKQNVPRSPAGASGRGGKCKS